MKHTTLIRPIASLLIWGGLLLPALIGCEVGEIPENSTNTTASNNSTPTYEHYDSLSLLLEGETIKQISYFKADYSPTTVHTDTTEQIKLLRSVLDGIPAEGYVDYCACGAIDIPRADICFILQTEGDGRFRFILDEEAKNLYYEYNDQSTGARRHSHLKVLTEHWTLLSSLIQTQCESLLPSVVVPSPESYLDLDFTEAQLFSCSYYENSNKVNSSNMVLSDNQTAEIIAQLKILLAGRTPVPSIPHDPTKRSWFEIHLFDSDNNPYVWIDMQSNGIYLDVWDSSSPSISNTYCFEIDPVVINEHRIWLSNYWRGNETAQFPSLEEYLNASFSHIKCYSPDDRDHAFYWTSLTSQIPIVKDTVQTLNSLSPTLVAEDIDPECSPSDGLFIEYWLNNSINSYSLFLELDSTGRILCRLKPLADQEAVSLYEAVYTLSPEEMAEFTDYIYAICKFDSPSQP